MMINWKPIDSAPKDGRRILIAHHDRCRSTETSFARWENNHPDPYWAYEGMQRITDCRRQVAIAWDNPPSPPTIESFT